MHEWFVAGLQTPGLGWLIVAATLAGLVRGFTGFGTAMVYLPIAGQFLSPIEALTTLFVMDFFGPLPLLARGWRDADRPELLKLSLAMVLGLPLGVLLLTSFNPETFRYTVSLLALILLAFLVGGVRYRGVFSSPLLYGTGALGGFMAGSVGLGGPPVIMLYMASPKPITVIRANTLIYLFLGDIGMLLILGFGGILSPAAVAVGLIVAVPYALSGMIGARVFRPGGERIYRLAAYGIIALSALSGLPLFD
jgi:uncharacterized membrane protein YfcA